MRPKSQETGGYTLDGTDVEEDIYEAYNISLLVTGQKASIAEGHGVRLNGEKYMHTRVRARADASAPLPARRPLTLAARLAPAALPRQVLEGETYTAKIKDADGNETGSFPVTIDQVHVLKKGPTALFIGVKGGYWFAVFADSKISEQTGPNAIAAMAIGFCASGDRRCILRRKLASDPPAAPYSTRPSRRLVCRP